MLNRELGIVTFAVTARIMGWRDGEIGFGHTGIEFTYRDARPLEIEMLVSGSNNRWIFARSIILEGLKRSGWGGIADVQAYNDGEENFYLRLESPDGWSVLTFKMRQMKQFAWETRMLVPEGEEQVNMDLVIAQIFKKEAEW